MSFAAPLWLVLFLPLMAVAYLLQRNPAVLSTGLPGAWSTIVDPSMRPLLAGRVKGRKSHQVTIALISACLLLLALARPVIGTAQITDFENLLGRAIVLDVSGTVDVVEQRLIVEALLAEEGNIPTLLIAVASDGFEVVPLTRDRAFLERYLAVLDPDDMPAPGRALHLGVLRADAALTRAGVAAKQVLLLTGGMPPDTMPRLPAVQREGALIPIAAKAADWRDTAENLGLKVVLPGQTSALTTDLVRRAERALQDVPKDGRLRLAPYLLAAAALSWLAFFRRRVSG